jgi:diguanylate cyclase (GGDEF)-like protein
MAPLPPPRLYPCALLIWAGLCTAPAWALDRNRSIAQHALDEWTTAEGLPRNTVEAMAQTPDGLLWFGTSDGLARLEGGQFRTWTSDDFPGVSTLHTNALAADREPGVLWLGTEGSGLLRFDYIRGESRIYREADGLCDDNISSLSVDSTGRLWIGTQSAMACSLEDGAFELYPLPTQGTKSVVDIATDKTGGVYLAALTDALLYAPPRAEQLQAFGGLPGPASAVLVDEDEGVFVGTTGFGVFQYHWDSATYQPIASKQLGSVSVRSLERDEQGVLWVGTTGEGVYRVRLDDDQVTRERDQLAAPMVTDLLADREGSLWISTMGYGVKRLVDHRLYTISRRHGLDHQGVLSLAEDNQGNVLIGTAGGGIYRLDGDGVSPMFPPSDPLSHAKVLSMDAGADGVTWASVYEGGLARITNGEVTQLGTESGLADLRTSTVLEDREGGLWVGHYSGEIAHLGAEQHTLYGVDQGLPGHAINAVLQRRDGTIWVGTRGGGAAVLEGDSFHVHTAADGLASDNINAIHEAGNYSLWFCTNEGLTRYANDEFFTIDSRHGLPAGAVHDMTEDRRGHLWLATDRGIVSLDRTQVAALVAGEIDTLTVKLFDHTRGMLTSECSGSHQHSVLKASDSNIYVATTGGLVVVEPDRKFDERPPPQAVLTHVEVDGARVAIPAPDQRPRLGRGQRDLVFHYLPSSNLHPRTTRFRHRLVGLDDDWVEAALAAPVRYPSLDPGQYGFEVQASADGSWSTPVTRVNFRIASYPWHWTWLWALLGCTGSAGALVLHRHRARRAASKQRDLEAALDAKARELRDAALVDPLTGLRNRRFVMEVILAEVVAFIAQKVRIQQSGTQRRTTAETGVYGVFLFDVDHFKTINDTLGHEAGDRMLQQFSYLLRRSVRQDDFVVRWGGEEFLVVLRFSDRDHLDQYARRVREQVERTTFLVSEASGGALKKTVSLGYCSLPFFDEEPSLLEFEQALLLADQAMYVAKESGRNRAVRAVSTGKMPKPGELRQMVRSLDWAIEHGFARLETFASKD